MSKDNKPSPPYPRLGELYRALAVALGTKGNNSYVDELARKGEFNWRLLPSLRNDLIVAPLAKYIDAEFSSMVDKVIAHVHRSYVGLVSTVALDSLNRDESLPLLIEHYFALHALGLIFAVKRGFGGPDLMQLLDPDLHPVAVVLAWLDEREPTPLAKLAYPKTTGTDRDNMEKYRKWAKGIDLPDLQSIVRFSASLQAADGNKEEKCHNVRRWILIARALAHLERESPIPFRAAMRRHLLLGMPDFDIGRTLSNAVIESGKRFSALTMPALTLYEKLKRTTPKDIGERDKLKSHLDQFARMTSELDPERRTQFHIEWMRGRLYVLSGKLDQALPHYEIAAELANYRAGEQQKKIIEETLVLAGHLRKKALIKRLKHRAVAFGLFQNPRGDDVVEDWEIEHLSQQFHSVFPAQGRFPESHTEEEVRASLPFLAFDEEKILNIKLDQRNPDRVISVRSLDGQIRRWSQLRLFAGFNRFEEVKTLLDLGASVDLLDECGASALLCAIQQADQTRDRRVLDLLLECPHSALALNSVTTRKQLTPLLCAIDLGEPDVVEKLLKMGASVDLRGNIVGHTPLYHALQRLGAVQKPGKLHNFLVHSLEESTDFMLKDVLRRWNIEPAGVFGEGERLHKLLDVPRYAEIANKLVEAMVAQNSNKHSLPSLLGIIELLLQHKANPNSHHHYPEAGRTPLMLAAENDSMVAFDLMLRNNGDPFQTDQAGMNCPKIAIAFRSSEVLRYMRSKGIM